MKGKVAMNVDKTAANDLSRENFWNDLLYYMEEGLVIPIIGQDLLVVDQSDGPQNVYDLLGHKIAHDLQIDKGACDLSLSQFVGSVDRFRDSRNQIYSRTKRAFDELNLPIPKALYLLANISAFRFYISTTFDPWMKQALDKARFDNSDRAISIAYTPEFSPDITHEQLATGLPIVFQLFGKICRTPHYAVTEEDMLEYLCSLQTQPPKMLCDELRTHHLLFIGNAFPDWLARFFIRTARGKRFIDQRGMDEFIVESPRKDESRLISFFHQFSRETYFYEGGSPIDFVQELNVRWLAKHPSVCSANTTDHSNSVVSPDVSKTEPWLFLSYARQDVTQVSKLRDALDKAGFNVWMDADRLGCGDHYREKIRGHIEQCFLFLPVISKTTEMRTEGFFILEWKWALERLQQMRSDRTFIIPVLLDDFRIDQTVGIPQEFKDKQVGIAIGGIPNDKLIGDLKKLVRNYVKQEPVSENLK